MSAVLKIQVATLSDAPEGESRIDGVPNQLVTIQSTGTGATHELAFWDVANPGVSGSTVNPTVPTLVPLGDGRTWTFLPPGGANAYGQSFGLELIVDRGLSTEARTRRKYAIPTQNQILILPLFGEGADREASLSNHGAVQVAASADNAGGNWRGYHPRLLKWIFQLDQYAGEINISPYPQNPIFGQPTTTPVHVATALIHPGQLFKVAADIGDVIDATKTVLLEIKEQGNPGNVLASWTVPAGLKLWREFALSSPFAVTNPAGLAAEIYISSPSSSGYWGCKGIRISTRIT